MEGALQGHYSDSPSVDTLAKRMRWVLSHVGLTQDEWSRAAGLSPGYVATTLTRATRNAGYAPSYEALQKLAAAASVDVRWLAEGRGRPMLAEQPQAPLPVPQMLTTRDDHPGLARAVLVAYRAGQYEPDVLAILELIRTGAAMLPVSSEEEAAEVMAGWLAAARRLRLAGQPVTMHGLAWEAHRTPPEQEAIKARSEALNHEAREELQRLGAEPPPVPVMPPRKKS